MLKTIKLNLDFNKIVMADYSQSATSCIKHQVHELTDIHEKYGGFPKSYCYANTVINQLWWSSDQLDFNDIGDQLGIEVVTISSIMQPPGSTIPLHRDTFYQVSQAHPGRSDLKVRANIFLEDYKVGHLIQYLEDSNVITSTNWCAGEGFMWDSSILHLGANNGLESKYTLQISGFLKS
jgi:hypothetical protein